MGNKLNVIPYCEVDGCRNLTDSFIRSLYQQMVVDGTEKTVFLDGSVNCADDFLRCMKHGESRLFLFAEDGKALGFFWTNTYGARSCLAHFCFFREPCRHEKWLSVAMGREGLKYLLSAKDGSGEYVLECVEGVTPLANKLACRFITKIGMKPLGEVPNLAWNDREGRSGPALRSYCTREILGLKED